MWQKKVIIIEICIPPTVSLSDGRRLTRFMTYDPYPGGEIIYT
jgi:hypothetical protein